MPIIKSIYNMLIIPTILLLLITTIFIVNINEFAHASSGTDIESIRLRKDETVYGILDNYGHVESTYVVNHFPIPQDGLYIDYGSYLSIENMTNLAEPKIQGDKIKWNLEQSEQGFYYKGELVAKELPWQVDITYLLDGKQVEAYKLGGAQGTIEIKIEFFPVEDGNSHFIDNYFAQIQVPINKRNTKIISANGASKVLLGENVTLAYTVLPKDSAKFELKLESTNFEMEGIDILLSPFTLADSLDLDEINQGFNYLSLGMDEINRGTLDLQDGMYNLSSGVRELNQGQRQLSNNARDIVKGMESYGSGIDEFDRAMPELVKGSREIKGALDQLSTEGEKLADGYKQIAQIGYGLEDGLLELVEEINQIMPDDIEHDHLLEVIRLYISLYDLEDEVAYALELLVEKLVELEEMHSNIKLLNEGLNEYTAGVSKLAVEYHVFHKNIEAIPEATGEFSSGFDSILRGNRHFVEGIYGVGDGLNQLDQQVREVPKAVGDLAKGQSQIKDGLNEAENALKDRFGLNGNDGEDSLSFVSSKNESVESVQFILRTPAITVPTEPQEDIDEEEKQGFFRRLLDLFGL